MLMKKAVSDTLAAKLWSMAMQAWLSSSQGVNGVVVPPMPDARLDEFSRDDDTLEILTEDDFESLEDLGIPTYLVDDDAMLPEEMDDEDDDHISRFFDVI